MFKIRYINGDVIETTSSPSSVLGSAIHRALQAYLGGEPDIPTPADDGEAIKHGHARGLEYLKVYSDGFISWTEAIPNRAKLEEKYAFCYFGYIKDFRFKDRVKEILNVEKMLKYRVEVEGQNLPIALKGQPDFVFRDFENKIRIEDHKITGAYSKEDEIDGVKLIQAAFMYFLVYADTGERPYSFTFREFKHTQNRDGSNQTREYTIIYDEVPLLFQLFYRFYQDVTNLLLGKAVFIPNMKAIFDKEVSILSYIYRLDISEERNKAFEKMKVENITDFLKQKIQKDGSIKKYMETVTAQFISASTLNYKDMQIEERIKYKMAEFGIGLEFHSKIVGRTVTLYCYDPSIGVKMSKVESFVKDIEQVVGRSDIRVLAPIPQTSLVGFEIPNKTRTFPILKLEKNKGFEVAIGEDIMGKTLMFDFRKAPHMLVAWGSGSGKSTFLNAFITQLLLKKRVHLHLFDPKQVELFQFEGLLNVVEYQQDPETICASLKNLVLEMENRYAEMKKLKVRDIESTNIPYKVIVIDEYADLIFRKDMGDSIQLLSQKGRACGIHLVIATQRASTKIISGDIKTNFLCKVVFKMSKAVDSRIMLDEDGAEKLLGCGDMLFVADKGIERLQGYEKVNS